MRAALIIMMVLWIAIYGMAFYGFGFQGILSGLDRSHYGPSEAVHFYIHWLFFLYPLFAVTGVVLSRLVKRRRK